MVLKKFGSQGQQKSFLIALKSMVERSTPKNNFVKILLRKTPKLPKTKTIPAKINILPKYPKNLLPI